MMRHIQSLRLRGVVTGGETVSITRETEAQRRQIESQRREIEILRSEIVSKNEALTSRGSKKVAKQRS